MSDNYYYPPGFDASVLDDGELVEEAVEQVMDELREDSAAMAEAIDDADHRYPLFEDVEGVARLLYRLHQTPADRLIGSDVLADLYREAKRVHAAIESALDRAAREELGV